MYFIKMMDSNRDTYKIIEVESLQYVSFSRISEEDFHSGEHTTGSPVVTLHLNIDGSESINFYPTGVTYVLNENGKTISTFTELDSSRKVANTDTVRKAFE